MADPDLALNKPTPIVTREAPTQHISPGEVAQPYAMLARSLDKLGQGAEDMAMPLAEQAGAQAVTRDAEGNIQVDRMPFFGKAGIAYQHAVKLAALAEGEGAAKRADIAIREKYRDDPQGYQVAAEAFRQKTMQQYGDAAGPEVASALGKAIDNVTTQTYRGLLNEKERLDLQRANNTINAGKTDAYDDAMALARQGASLDDPAFKAARDKYQTLLDAQAANPRLAYTQEQRTLDLAKFDSELGAQRHLWHVDQTYKANGYQAAMDDAKDILTNENYKLKPAQRESYFHKAVAEIRANEAIRTQDYQLANQNWTDIKADLALGNRVDPSVIDAQIKAFQTIGGVKGANGVARVNAYMAHHSLNDDHGKQPLSEQNNALDLMTGAPRQRFAYDFFRSKGLSPEAAAGMVGGFKGETANLNTMEVHDRGIGFGIAGWNKERLAAFTQFAKDNKMSLADLRTQLEFSWHELNTTEGATLARLRAARTPEEAGNAALGYFRPANFDQPGAHPERARYARAAYDVFAGGGQVTPGSLLSSPAGAGPGITSWLQARRTADLKTAATQTWSQVWKDWDNGKGQVPSRETLNDVLEAAQRTNNIDLMAKVARDTELMDYAERIKQRPLDEQAALTTELRRRIAAGETRQADVPASVYSPGADLVLKTLQERTQAIRAGLEKDPIATAVGNFPDKFKTPAPLDPSNPQQFQAGLAMRAQIAQTAAHNWGTPPLSALDEGDVTRIKQALANPDPGARAAVWSSLATLPDDVRGPTFEKIAKGDPNARAEAGAGAMMREDPAMARSIMVGLQMLNSNHNNILDAFKPKAGGSEGFDVELPGMLPPTAFGTAETRLNPAGDYATTSRMIQARYAYLAGNDPKGTTFSANRLQQAVDDVTGGTVSQAGRMTIAPSRGMSQAMFDRTMVGITDQDLAGVTDLAGRPVSANFLRREGRLEAVGPGRYLVNFSDGIKPVYAFTNATEPLGVKPFVLDLTGRQPAPQLRYDLPSTFIGP